MKEGETHGFWKDCWRFLEYAREGLAGKWAKWFLLLISCIVFPLIMGYMMRIYRGANPSPEPDNWGTMFIDGLKLFVVGIIYALPVIILEIAIIGSAGLALFTGAVNPPADPTALMGLFGAVLIGFFILLVVAIIVGLISTIASVRFCPYWQFWGSLQLRGNLYPYWPDWMDYLYPRVDHHGNNCRYCRSHMHDDPVLRPCHSAPAAPRYHPVQRTLHHPGLRQCRLLIIF